MVTEFLPAWLVSSVPCINLLPSLCFDLRLPRSQSNIWQDAEMGPWSYNCTGHISRPCLVWIRTWCWWLRKHCSFYAQAQGPGLPSEQPLSFSWGHLPTSLHFTHRNLCLRPSLYLGSGPRLLLWSVPSLPSPVYPFQKVTFICKHLPLKDKEH